VRAEHEGLALARGFAKAMLLSEYLSQELTEALPIKGGGVLKTIQDAYEYVGALPLDRAMRSYWQETSAAILQEAEAVKVSEQVKFALVLDDELDFARLIRARRQLRDG
jgi:hypothetical protein